MLSIIFFIFGAILQKYYNILELFVRLFEKFTVMDKGFEVIKNNLKTKIKKFLD